MFKHLNKISATLLVICFLVFSASCKQGTNGPNNFTVRFFNGTVFLQVSRYAEPSVPVYRKDIPKRSDSDNGSDEIYKYCFSGWSPKIEKVYNNTDYIAQFHRTVYKDSNIKVIDDIENNLENQNIIFTNGRTYNIDNKMYFNNASSGFEISFVGTTLKANISSNGADNETIPKLAVVIDDSENYTVKNLEVGLNDAEIILAENLSNKLHTVKVYKIQEADISSMAISKIETDGTFYSKNAPVEKKELFIEAYGDCAMTGTSIEIKGLDEIDEQSDSEEYTDENQNSLKNYVSYVSRKLKASFSVVSNTKFSLMENAKEDRLYINNYYDKIFANEKNYVTDSTDNPVYEFDKKPDFIVVDLGTSDLFAGENVNDIIEKYKSFVDTLFDKYNDDVKIIICSGSIKEDLNSKLSEYVNNEHNENLYYLTLKKCKGDFPTYKEQQKNSELLQSKILDIINKTYFNGELPEMNFDSEI